MSAVLLAVFNSYQAADHVRVHLIQDGFPTDRVDVTCSNDLGRAALGPGKSLHDKCAQYFRTLLCEAHEKEHIERLADRVEHGAVAVTVLPRGALETARASQIIGSAQPVEVVEHDINNHGMEHAAARYEKPWVSNFWVESDNRADCIYCRLFERAAD
jgi:hypothetical protein